TNLPIIEKIEAVAMKIYGAKGVKFSPQAIKDIELANSLGFDKTPICIAKTQYSLSDNPSLLGRPIDFEINISKVNISSGAGFLVCLAGNIMTMPGLPKAPAAYGIDVDDSGKINGLF
ncbi:MAG: formate--tetrahydrofolate ligase, partial [Oscillospiraceae bacterium]